MVPTSLLKMFALEISGPVTKIFNKYMQNVYFPAKWKCASACAISKTLHVPEFDQIYPISMTFVLAGVFESFLADCLMVDFKPHIDPAQY